MAASHPALQNPENFPEVVKLSHIIKHDRILKTLMTFYPTIWPKMRMLSKLFSWRLTDAKLHEMCLYLNEKFNIVHQNPFELCSYGFADIIYILITLQGALSPWAKDGLEHTLLQRAVHSNKKEMVHLLLEKACVPGQPVPVNVKGAYGYTPLHECAYLGNVEIGALLLAHKANPDALSRNGSTPLLVAAREGHADLVRLLLSNGAHPDDGGDKAWTPLFVAAGEGHVDIVQALLEKGANPFEANGHDGRLPIQEAADGGHATVVMLLEDAQRQIWATMPRADAMEAAAMDHGTTATIAPDHGTTCKNLIEPDDGDEDDGDTPLVIS